ALHSVDPGETPQSARVLGMGLDFLRRSARADGSWPIDTNLSVWVTSGAFNALEFSGGLPRAEAESTREWLALRQYHQEHPYTGAAPGGFGWTHLPGGVPDADDTAGALLALAGWPAFTGLEDGVKWLLALQNSDGGWPTFCRGWGKLPFDKSCDDLTAHALRVLRSAQTAVGAGNLARAVSRGLDYLSSRQRPDGSWVPLWFGNQQAPEHLNPVLGTSRVLLAWAELDHNAEEALLGLQFLVATQSDDGGWGGAAGVPSTVEETALAISALSHWPQECNTAVQRGLDYLLGRVENGDWTRPAPLGLYFASLWYSEELYPIIWTVEALGRVLSAAP
ncbi:MAG: prenyltransferase/squalene oxidase repeat-containing protein, partial [Armatimonadota bacterium]